MIRFDAVFINPVIRDVQEMNAAIFGSKATTSKSNKKQIEAIINSTLEKSIRNWVSTELLEFAVLDVQLFLPEEFTDEELDELLYSTISCFEDYSKRLNEMIEEEWGEEALNYYHEHEEEIQIPKLEPYDWFYTKVKEKVLEKDIAV